MPVNIRKHPCYRSWTGMRYNTSPNAPARVQKLFRGVGICPEWDNYANFEDWAFSHGFQPGLRLTRKDKTKDFCPENCIWTTMGVFNGWLSTVRRMEDGRSARDIIGRENLGSDEQWHRRVAQRIFAYQWNDEEATNIPIRPQRERGHSRSSSGESPLYHSWITMRKFVARKSLPLCWEWNDYEIYREWALSNGWRKDLRLVRRDQTLGYSPDNCFWGSHSDAAICFNKARREKEKTA